MPTYDYLCTKCGHKFEEIQKMSDPALTKCPKCKGKLKRLIGVGVGIIFKGSGFYVTDSRKSSSAVSSSPKKEPSGAAESTTSETKGTGGEAKASDKSSEKSSEKSSAKS